MESLGDVFYYAHGRSLLRRGEKKDNENHSQDIDIINCNKYNGKRIRRKCKMVDFIIVTVIAGAVAGIVWKKIKDNKEGKGGCSCGNCGGCSSKGMCHKG